MAAKKVRRPTIQVNFRGPVKTIEKLDRIAASLKSTNTDVLVGLLELASKDESTLRKLKVKINELGNA
jgi:hypothetical protein